MYKLHLVIVNQFINLKKNYGRNIYYLVKREHR